MGTFQVLKKAIHDREIAGTHTTIDGKEVKIFYAVAYEYIENEHVKGGIEHMHAKDVPEARHAFVSGHPELVNKHLRIVGIAPAIGFKVLDEHGDKLIA
jgi:hypothetical protein